MHPASFLYIINLRGVRRYWRLSCERPRMRALSDGRSQPYFAKNRGVAPVGSLTPWSAYELSLAEQKITKHTLFFT
jgi:hypothetical protein